ncbi:MAG: hypothetical protein M1820_006220 [Bogoriella megaspora]|nr:MAG: hypothetical protein M1820_006220 [Bogoriella megaspora]
MVVKENAEPTHLTPQLARSRQKAAPQSHKYANSSSRYWLGNNAPKLASGEKGSGEHSDSANGTWSASGACLRQRQVASDAHLPTSVAQRSQASSSDGMGRTILAGPDNISQSVLWFQSEFHKRDIEQREERSAWESERATMGDDE